MATRWIPFAALAAALALAGGCSSDDEAIKPSPIPPGYAMLLRQQQGAERNPQARTAGGQTVDETLAVVDAEVLTRRELLRSLRLTAEDAKNPDVEEEIRGATLAWARERLIVGAARRAGMRIPESAVDDIAKGELARQMKENEEKTGQKLNEDDYLRQRRLTWGEFRTQLSGAVTTEYYTRKLYEGIGGTRPRIDKEVTPSEVRRIYHDHREKFDEPYGVKVALFQVPSAAFETEGRDFLEAEQMAETIAGRLAEGFRAGQDPKALAQRFKIQEGRWQVSQDFIVRFPQPAWSAWMFAPARRTRDANIFNDGAGPVVLGVVDVRPARRRTLEDPMVYDLIVNLVQGARKRRMLAELTLDLLRRGAVVWPAELHDDLLDAAYEDLDLVDTHEIVGKARLK